MHLNAGPANASVVVATQATCGEAEEATGQEAHVSPEISRCSKCVLPETVPGITFDEAGVCSFCRDHQEEECLGEEELGRIVTAAKGHGGKYDCIVPLSGGRDSAFVLHLAKAVYGLNPLAVNYDNEFRTDQAAVNMQKACDTLGVDFITVRSRLGVGRRIVKHNMRFFGSEYGLPLHGICYACTYGYFSAAYRAAEKHGAPLILWGTSKGEQTVDARRKIFSGLGRKPSKLRMLMSPSFYATEFSCLLQRMEFRVPRNSLFKRYTPVLRNDNIREVAIFDYVPWDRQRIKDVIMGELGWEKPRAHVSTWRTDCKLHPLMNYYFYELFGCTKDCLGYCNMIGAGQLTREEALAQEEELAARRMENMRELLRDEIGFGSEEVERMLVARW